MEITVIFPAYNEAHSIEDAMQRSLAALKKHFTSFEILIVNDGSKDGMGKLADELAERHSEIRVLHNERNMGAGASLVRGFQDARGDLILHNAIDLPFDLEDMPLLLAELDDADIVVASRMERAGYSSFRRLTSVVNITLLHTLFDLKLRDYNFVQLYRREVLRTVKARTQSTAFITPETMIRAHDKGFRIKEVPVTYHARTRGVATSGSLKVITTSMRDMFTFWAQRRLGR